MCLSITEAVSYLHSKKICHRDIKPENILFDSESENAKAKLSDFGLAKKLSDRKQFLNTLCGTLSYIAPEILLAAPYDLKIDAWSLGVVTFVTLAGYQPFRPDFDDDEDDEAIKRNIVKSKVSFDEKYWGGISDQGKSFVSSLLHKKPSDRLSIEHASKHLWFSSKLSHDGDTEKQKVFFMIGSQRSGSNWLRTMLDEREDLAGPHPPHMMRDIMPIIDKFGDLKYDDNFRVLVDHVCTFAENNQVPWTDMHGKNIKFARTQVYKTAAASCQRILSSRAHACDTPEDLSKSMYLLCVFDAVMEYYTNACGKRTWVCKSMGMSKFHHELLEFYGTKRLRYIYLVRDPRDVAMSFMKTPVGDCHYHAIASKWTQLQISALEIIKVHPQLVHQVHYEQILESKTETLTGIYNFIGERRFGGLKRQASVLHVKPVEECLNNSRHGFQALLAKTLSSQFENLGRGESFAAAQLQKWADPENGLNDDELLMIESVAETVMYELGYETQLVGKSHECARYSADDLASFSEANKIAIQAMNDILKVEDPADFERRQKQAKVLTLAPELLNDWSTESGPTNAPFVSDKKLDETLSIVGEEGNVFESGVRIRWGRASQQGFNPVGHQKPNQDTVAVHTVQNGSARRLKWFSVLDGHGVDGHKCSQFVADSLPWYFEACLQGLASSDSKTEASGHLGCILKKALSDCHIAIHEKLIKSSGIDCSRSGTTATTVLFEGDNKCLISNIGDSTCILGQKSSSCGRVTATKLVTDHNLYNPEEKERIRRAGAQIMTVEEKESLEVEATDVGPRRIWHPRLSRSPGVAFTRSLGDTIAHSLGVISEPEVVTHTLGKDDRFLILCSDGVTEWMDATLCGHIVDSHCNASEAATALVKEARNRWIKETDYVDDISAIVIFLGESKNGTCKLPPLGNSAVFWTLFAGAASGYLGGLCGIRGPPLILYFLYPPYPVAFTKKSQRATGACITATNVLMRIVYYIVESTFFDGYTYFTPGDWGLYVLVFVSSLSGALVGDWLFKRMKDSRETMRGILTIFLVLCGVSLLLTSFAF